MARAHSGKAPSLHKNTREPMEGHATNICKHAQMHAHNKTPRRALEGRQSEHFKSVRQAGRQARYLSWVRGEVRPAERRRLTVLEVWACGVREGGRSPCGVGFVGGDGEGVGRGEVCSEGGEGGGGEGGEGDGGGGGK